MHLGETLLPWNSKEKKCSLYETPYVTAPIWILGDVIAKFYALCTISNRRTYKSQNFFWFTSDAFRKRHILSFWDSYVKFLQGDLRAKVVPERATYRITWGVLQRVPSSISTSRLRSDSPSWEKSLRNPEEQEDRKKRDVEQSAPTQVHHTHCTSRQLGTTANRRYDVPRDWLQEAFQMARVRWGTRCKGFCSEEGPHYWIDQSARNQLECDQVRRAPEKSSSSCHQTSNNQPLFTSLEIPLGFLSRAVLHWLSRGLCHAKKCQFKDLCEKKRYDSRLPNGRSHEKPLAKGGTGKECRY